MEQKYLIDTNSIVDYLGFKLPENGMFFMNDIIDEIPSITIITKIELLSFNAPKPYFEILSNFISDTLVLDLSQDIVDVTISIRRKY